MRKNAVLIAIVVLTAPLLMAQSSSGARTPKGRPQPRLQASIPSIVSGNGTTTPSGLTYWDIQVGTGETAAKGKVVKIHYTGWVEHGKEFLNSVTAHTPSIFKLGDGQVIEGWEEGVDGMKVGGKRQLRIPPELAYGPTGFPPYVLPNSTVIFDVQLIGVQ